MNVLADKLGRTLLLGTAAWGFTAGTGMAQATGTVTTYPLAGITFPTNNGGASGLDGSGHFILAAGAGWAKVGPPAGVTDGELVVTLATPGTLDFAFGVTSYADTGQSGGHGPTGFATSLYGGGSEVDRLVGGDWAGNMQSGPSYGYNVPMGLVWRLARSGSKWALYIDEKIFFAGDLTNLPYGIPPAGSGTFAIQHNPVDGQASAAVVSVKFNTVPSMPAVTGLTVQFSPISTAMLKGVPVLQVTSTTPSGNHNYSVTGTGAAYVGINAGTGLGTLLVDNPPLGPLTFTVTDSDSGTSVTGSFNTSVVTGTTFAASAMPVSVTAGLTNASPAGITAATFPVPAGMTGSISYSLQVRPPTIEGPGARYVIDATARSLKTVARMSASPEPLTLVATNGVDVCAVPFSINAAAVVGPVLEVGPGLAYPRYSNATSALCEDALNGTHAFGPGAKIRLHARAGRRDLYGELAGGTDVYDRGQGMAYGGYLEPYSIEGVPDPVTGALPVVGGAPGYYGKGSVLLTQDRDVSVSNLEAENVVTGGNNVSGIKDDGGRQADTVITNFYGHNCHNGYLGTVRGKLTFKNSLLLMNGTGDTGHTHNAYIDALETEFRNILSSAANGGHVWKDRSVVGNYYDSVFDGGVAGRGSAVIDMPNGGTRTFTNTKFVKQTMENNVGCIQYAREVIPPGNGGPSYTQNNEGGSIHFDNCDFVNLYHGAYGNGDAIAVWMKTSWGLVPINPATGLPVQATFTNCRQFGFKPNKFLCIGNDDNGGTTFPPGVTTLAEPPPADFRSPLLNGAPVRQPSPWWHPNPQSYTGFNCDCEPGIMDPGVHELRVRPDAGTGTAICQLKTWGHMDVASSDPAFDPWGTGAVYTQMSSGIPRNPYFDVTPGGIIHPTQSILSAPVLSWIRVQVSNAAGDRKTDACFPIINSYTPSRTDNIPAGLGPRVLPLGQEALA